MSERGTVITVGALVGVAGGLGVAFWLSRPKSSTTSPPTSPPNNSPGGNSGWNPSSPPPSTSGGGTNSGSGSSPLPSGGCATKTLRQGQHNLCVALLQGELNLIAAQVQTPTGNPFLALASNTGAPGALTVDGTFGPLTASAVQQLQSRLGLAVDGVVGPHTWAGIAQIMAGITQNSVATASQTAAVLSGPPAPASTLSQFVQKAQSFQGVGLAAALGLTVGGLAATLARTIGTVVSPLLPGLPLVPLIFLP